MKKVVQMVAEFVALSAWATVMVTLLVVLAGCENYPELDGKLDEGQAKGLWDLVMPIVRHEG